MKEKREVTFWATTERKPLVQAGAVEMPDGSKKEFKSKNEYKEWRKGVKKQLKTMRKAGK